MIPENGNYYPWQLELWAWGKANQEKPGYSPGVRMSEVRAAKLSDVLRCLDAARNTPEVWNRIVAQARRPYVDPGLVADDHPEVAIMSDVGQFVGWFCDWFRMKNGLDDAGWGYGEVNCVLQAISRDEVDRSDLAEMKKRLGKFGIIDDLCVGEPQRGGDNV